MNPLDGLDVFVEIADAKSFSRAAQRLGMPTTTVSAKIARLEERLGVTLFRRTTRKISLTEAGARYYADCAPALKAVQQAQASLRDDIIEPSGILRMTAPPDIAQIVLPPVLDLYLRRYPKVELQLRVTNSFADLVGDKIDLAIRVGALEDSSLIVRKLTQGRMSFWASQAYLADHGTPVQLADLDQHRLIWLSHFQRGIDLFGPDGGQTSVTSKRWLEVDDIQTLRHYVQRGLGIGLLPQFDIASSPAPEHLVQVLPDYQTEPFRAVFAYPKQSFVPMTVRSFIDTAVEVIRGK